MSLATILREWGRIGCIGFGGPPTHIKLLRELCVERHSWLDAREFEDGIAATNMLPGPASTQLAIFCAWRLRGTAGALVGGACFIVPGSGWAHRPDGEPGAGSNSSIMRRTLTTCSGLLIAPPGRLLGLGPR